MKRNIILLVCLVFTTNCLAQVQEAIEGLVGTYATYFVADMCQTPQSFSPYGLEELEITAVENTDNIKLIHSIVLPDTSFEVTTLVLVQLEDDSIVLNTIQTAFQSSHTEVIGQDSLILTIASPCLACHCGYRHRLSKNATVRIDSRVNSSWSIYPNPAQQFIWIEKKHGTLLAETQVSVIDNNGKVIYHQLMSTNKVKIPLSRTSPGVYSIQIEERTVRKTKQFIKIDSAN